MSKIFCLAVAILFPVIILAQGGKQITLEDIWKNNTFKIKDVSGFRVMKDGIHYTQLDHDDSGSVSIGVYNLETGKKERTIFHSGMIPYAKKMKLNFESYVFSEDEKKMLIYCNSESIYRHSATNLVVYFEVGMEGIPPLVDYSKLLHATLSPDGKRVAFVKDNNLFVKDIAASAFFNVTTDGEVNKVINGNCDWVYEEEFSFTKAFEWSPDSKYIAYYRFDERNVPTYTIPRYTGLYPEQYTYKYPKAGENNSIVQINFYNVETKQTEWANIPTDANTYIPRIKWTNDPGKLCIYKLNRHQNKLELLLTNAADGTVNTIFTDSNKYYININDEISFLPDGHSMILSSERNGYSHLYNYDWEKNNMTDLTPGSFDVDGLKGVDKVRKLVYYTSTESSSTERRLYVADWQGKNKKCLTTEPGMHSITPCEGFNFFLDRYSRADHVPVYYLRNAKGDIVKTLEDNKNLENTMKDFALGKVQLMQLKGANDMLNAWMITPPDFDKTKKYPVLMYQYSGPGSQEVADRFPLGNFFWHQMLAEKGYIVVCADGTGTGARGEEFRKKTYLQLGKYESDDQIAVARSLGELPYVDKDRIGIWGWSYGGFMSSTCLLKGNDVFKAAIAVAPVTNWRYYDNIYTERYMRTPQENPGGYDDNAPEKMADRLKGKFLLIHGTADDNVHFQNSVMLTAALINAGKQFESEYYPDKAHGISGGNTRFQLYSRMTDFILKNL